MMQNLNIRKMEVCDIPDVARLERENFSNPWTASMLEEELNLECSTYFVAEYEGAVIGYGGLQNILGEGYITNIAVSTEFRRRGVASAILARMLEETLDFLSLEVRAGNLPAIALYERFGFLPCGRRRGYYTNPDEDAIIMTVTRGESK